MGWTSDLQRGTPKGMVKNVSYQGMTVRLVLGLVALTGPLQAAPTSSPAPQATDDAYEPTLAWLGGNFASASAPPMTASAVGSRVLEVTLNLPSQTMAEDILIGLPVGATSPAPMLVLFHGYGEHPRTMRQRTPLFDEALARGWVVVAPLGAHERNYGIDYAQENTRLALEIVASRVPIDPERIYGVGFSMGGGWATSFAARHQDPNGVRFAAVVNHTGCTSLTSEYMTGTAQAVFSHPLMFGAPPNAQNAFDYGRASTVEHDPLTNTLVGTDHMARNLGFVPVRNTYGYFDPNLGLVEQTLALHDYLDPQFGQSEELPLQTAVHAWTTVDSTSTLDWLEQQTLEVPGPADIVRTLADRSGAWHQAELELRDDRAFGEILWSAQPALGALYTIGMANLESVTLDLGEIGQTVTPGQPLQVVAQSLDGEAPVLRLSGLGGPPAAVVYGGGNTGTWTYDAQNDVLELVETGPASWARWSILP